MTFKSSTNFQKLYLILCVVRMAKKGCQNVQNNFFSIEKLSAAILFSLLVKYERVNQIAEYLIFDGSLYNNKNYSDLVTDNINSV